MCRESLLGPLAGDRGLPRCVGELGHSRLAAWFIRKRPHCTQHSVNPVTSCRPPQNTATQQSSSNVTLKRLTVFKAQHTCTHAHTLCTHACKHTHIHTLTRTKKHTANTPVQGRTAQAWKVGFKRGGSSSRGWGAEKAHWRTRSHHLNDTDFQLCLSS